MKQCIKCKMIKSFDEFHKQKKSLDGFRSICKTCRKIDEKVSNKVYRNSDKRKDFLLKWRYGVSKETLDQMYVDQQGKCAICNQFKTEYNKAGGLYVDHCHNTGKVRGLLCNYCNTLLGMAKEDITILLKAVEYLVKKKG